jgi:hypothetical protein
MRPDSITLAIFEKYKPAELADVAQKMAAAQSDMEAAEAEKKVSDGVFNERIKKHAAEVHEHAQRYNKGGETAQIGCTIRYDIPTVGKKSYIRMDTEEAVEVHDMSLQEKQETLQFPLSAASPSEPQVEDQPKPAESTPPPSKPAIEKTTEITFKDIQAIASHIIAMPMDEVQAAAKQDMQDGIALKLSGQPTAIGPDGRVETIDSSETAQRLAKAWLELAIESALAPPSQAEEVTRICPYPGCILFVDHDGIHEFPKVDAGPSDAAPAPEAQPQREKKPRKKRGFAPPPDPPESRPGEPGVH